MSDDLFKFAGRAIKGAMHEIVQKPDIVVEDRELAEAFVEAVVDLVDEIEKLRSSMNAQRKAIQALTAAIQSRGFRS
jgi:(p)ppGpp synthase/HD superfamily hydrolase